MKQELVEALMACRLIPLDKNPGLRPIGIGEVLRRIVGKMVAGSEETAQNYDFRGNPN